MKNDFINTKVISKCLRFPQYVCIAKQNSVMVKIIHGISRWGMEVVLFYVCVENNLQASKIHIGIERNAQFSNLVMIMGYMNAKSVEKNLRI